MQILRKQRLWLAELQSSDHLHSNQLWPGEERHLGEWAREPQGATGSPPLEAPRDVCKELGVVRSGVACSCSIRLLPFLQTVLKLVSHCQGAFRHSFPSSFCLRGILALLSKDAQDSDMGSRQRPDIYFASSETFLNSLWIRRIDSDHYDYKISELSLCALKAITICHFRMRLVWR